MAAETKKIRFFGARSKVYCARTAAHNQVCKFPAASLSQTFGSSLVYRETLLSQAALIIELFLTAIVLQSGRKVVDTGNLILWQYAIPERKLPWDPIRTLPVK